MSKNNEKKKRKVRPGNIVMVVIAIILLLLTVPKLIDYLKQTTDAIGVMEDVRDERGLDADRYKNLKEQYPDLIAWITVPDTNIDYPVMYSEKDDEKYFHHDINGDYLYAGEIFLEGYTDLERSQNWILYGHHMNTGIMFGKLESYYKEEEDLKENQTIYLDKIHDDGSYTRETYTAVVSIRQDTRTKDENLYLSYYNILSKEDMDKYEEIANDNAMATNGEVEFADDDIVLTLSTCSYFVKRPYGRFAVIAKRVGIEDP